MKLTHLLVLATASGLLLNASCSSDTTPAAPLGPVGGPVSSAADAHCQGRTPVAALPAACTMPDAAAGGAPDAAAGGAPGHDSAPSEGGSAGDKGSDCNQTHDADYGDTLPNSSGADDDCKYEVSWTSTPVRLDQDVTFAVTTMNLTTHQPLEGLDDGKLPLSRVEVYQPCNPTRRGPAQNFKATFSETAPGVYSCGPLRFDQSGRWVVRFHFYEQCLDGEHSPHGHVAFFVDVP